MRKLNPLWLARLARIGLRRLVRRLALSHLFLIAAIVVVAAATLVVGNWVGAYLRAGISEGVARTAAASVEALIAGSFEGLGPERPLRPEDRRKLDEIFRIANEAESTRLLQISIRDPDGEAIYQSLGGIADENEAADFARAAAGTVVAEVRNLEVAAAGPLAGHTLPVLKIHTPLRRAATGEIFAVAELFFSARATLEIEGRAQRDVWLLVGVAGIAVIAALYVLVDRASRTIAQQRANLARNLAASRRLSEEVSALHAASEQLRLEANLSNERLLAQVGSDLHDGPIQLLTLIILRLSGRSRRVGGKEALADLQQTAQLAAEAMAEIRNISTGLVLPELSELTLTAAVELAIARHESATGRDIIRDLEQPATPAWMPAKICAYRVVQEALNNAFRHGGPAPPSVALSVVDGRCRIEVRNEVGASADTWEVDAAGSSLGLRSMRFRVESLGGELHVDPQAESRTIRIVATFPLGEGAAQLPPPTSG